MRIKHILIFIFLLFLNLLPLAIASAQPDIGLEYGSQTGLGYADPRVTIAQIIRSALGLLGILTTVIIMYAGFKWMTAGGNEDEVTSAKKILSSAVIGLAVIMSAFAISSFVIKSLYKSTAGVDIP